MKNFFLFVILFIVTFSVNAQFEGKKYLVSVGAMGTFTIEFQEKTFTLSNADGNLLVKGEYMVEGNTITFIDKEGPISCQPGNKGKYIFTAEQNQLQLEMKEENCPGRKGLATSPWKLLKDK
jgi:hypothetical protein